MSSLSFNHIGKAFSVKDSIVQVSGLDLVTSGEMITGNNNQMGLVLNLEFEKTGIVMFDENSVMAGDIIKRTSKTLNVEINLSKLGIVLNPLALNLTRYPRVFYSTLLDILEYFGVIRRSVELKAPGIIVRQPVYETVWTGTSSVDATFPIGSGQRELIIGDRQTGKTSLSLNFFLNQSLVEIIVINVYEIYYNG